MLISKKIRLEVSEQDVATLEFMQGKCRGLYNWWVMRLRDGERWPGWQEAKKTLQESREHDSELKFVYGKLLQEVYFRLDGSMKAFFRRVKSGEKPGFPRVRPRHCFFTLIYPAMYIKVEGMHITLPTGGKGKNKHFPDVVANFNDWGLYIFVQMLAYKCMLYGKELVLLDERDTSKTCSGCGNKQNMPLWKRTYRCPNTECRLSLDRDENSTVNILKRYLARLGPHVDRISMRCADVFTAIEDVNMFKHI